MSRNQRLRGAVFGCVLLCASVAAADPVSRLAEAVRFRTVSPQQPSDFDPEPFLAFHAFLAEQFPETHRVLQRETVSEYSLLYTWPGSDPSLPPVLLAAHQDVVPVIPGSLERWTQPPFGGVVADGAIWGRGTLDDKVGVMGILEAVESLARAGFAPRRTLYLAFGHDEEIGGDAGAGAITDLLASRGVELWFTLDEGMAIVEGVSGLSGTMAMVGIGEKGFLTLELTATAEGGHSSMPPRSTAIGKLARAVLRLEARPLPAHLDGISGEMLEAASAQLPATQRFTIRQRWLFGPMLERALSRDPSTNAMIRTTTAVTMARAGVKENVLPSKATAVVNFRVHPEETTAQVIEHVRKVVGPEIEIAVLTSTEPSPLATTDSAAYAVLRAAIEELAPGVPVVPALVVGGTDSKHYARIAGDAYRFAPVRFDSSDRARIHGIDERIPIAVYEGVPVFFEGLIRRVAGPDPEG